MGTLVNRLTSVDGLVAVVSLTELVSGVTDVTRLSTITVVAVVVVTVVRLVAVVLLTELVSGVTDVTILSTVTVVAVVVVTVVRGTINCELVIAAVCVVFKLLNGVISVCNCVDSNPEDMLWVFKAASVPLMRSVIFASITDESDIVTITKLNVTVV